MKTFVTQLSFITDCDQDIVVQDGEFQGGSIELVTKESDGKQFKIYLSKENAKTLVEMLQLMVRNNNE